MVLVEQDRRLFIFLIMFFFFLFERRREEEELQSLSLTFFFACLANIFVPKNGVMRKDGMWMRMGERLWMGVSI